MSDRCSNVLRAVRRTLGALVADLAKHGRQGRVLDVGCWDGSATVEYAKSVGAVPHGIEIFPEPAVEAERRGVVVARLNLETDRFPWPDGSMDIVIANQVLEHLKNVWLPLSEMFRVTRVGGWVLLAVPNLASLHNRVLLAFGQQPTCIRTRGPHVRSFTLGELRRIVETEGVAVLRAGSVGFYPFPTLLARPLTSLWPGAGHTAVVLARKLEESARPGGEMLSIPDQQSLQTFYGSAPRDPAPAPPGRPPLVEAAMERGHEATIERVR